MISGSALGVEIPIYKGRIPSDSNASICCKRLAENGLLSAQRIGMQRTSFKIFGCFVGLLASCVSVFSSTTEQPPFFAEGRKHWAFQKVTRPAVPTVQHTNSVANPVDAFVIAALEKKGIAPGSVADKRRLVRRAYLDLIGVPPTPEQVERFLADNSAEAFAKVIDELLASPHYGERWARHWLDLARYAESEGFKADETRPNAWRYRDYVIASLNSDKPYSCFVQEQIAGDELWPKDSDARIATAFNRHYPDESNARNLMQRRQEILNDITDTVGGVFMGLTYACARCHDHKFEPILQSDYYRLQAFFANTAAKDDLTLTSQGEVKRYREKLAIWEEKTRAIREQMEEIEAPKRKALEEDYFEKYPSEIRAILNKPEGERNPFERQMAWKAKQYLDPKSHEYVGDTEAVLGKLKGEEKRRWQELKAELDRYANLHPGNLPIGSGMSDIGAEAPKTFVLSKGSYEKPVSEVEPGFLTLLDPEPAPVTPLPGITSTGRRAALAKWLTDPANPLSARVVVNRVWHYHFGRGIAATPSDLGLKGERPTHPELLDWLASEFIAHNWSIKYLHRLIMTSRVYQQASQHRAKAAQIDPENKLLWRFPMQRLEGEIIRDSALTVAGLLNPKMGGPSIFPELPPGMPTPRGGWKINDDPEERNRRSIYVFVRRNTRYPLFESFDMPDPHESCSRRNVTTSPIQALNLLNSKLMLEWAQSFAARVIANGGDDLDRQIDTAFRLAYCRPPAKDEKQMAREFFAKHRRILAERLEAGEKVPLPRDVPGEVQPADAATLVDMCHMLLNANEFVYRN
jgi:hypothetical protein